MSKLIEYLKLNTMTNVNFKKTKEYKSFSFMTKMYCRKIAKQMKSTNLVRIIETVMMHNSTNVVTINPSDYDKMYHILEVYRF